MSPRTLPGIVFLTGVVIGSIVSFIGIHMISPPSSVMPASSLQALLPDVERPDRLVREIDVELLCKIYQKVDGGVGVGVTSLHSYASHAKKKRSSRTLNAFPSSAKAPVSHDDISKQIEKNDGDTHFADEHQHHDEVQVAKDLAKSVRVLCWVMTSPENHKKRAVHVQATWGKRCDKLLFVSEQKDASLPILQVSVDHGREHLTAKTMTAFDHIYEHHRDEADWFIKADDDTYVVVENLKYFLSSQNSTEPVYFGHHFKTIVKQGYFSGGGGYVLSREALRRFGNRQKGMCRDDDGAEDAEMGRCMEMLGVRTGDSRDSLGRSRFHCFNPETHIHGGYPDWYYTYDKYGAKKGADSISDYAITFHYVSVEQLYNLEFYVYHLRPYGIVNRLQELNRDRSASDDLLTGLMTPPLLKASIKPPI